MRSKLQLQHLALAVSKLEESEYFYVSLLGMQVIWRPDHDNVYLSSGTDNLALHRTQKEFTLDLPQRLEHLGFCVSHQEDVTLWYQNLIAHNVPCSSKPKVHRDGSCSFYCSDPDGNSVQILWLPYAN